MKQEMSPKEVFSYILKVWLVLCVLTFGSCSAGFYLDQPYTEKTSHNASLEVAYSTMGRCDKYGSCTEVYKGRLKTEDGQRYDREIDGFFYHRFVDEGRKPMDAYITLSANDQGVETPGWIEFLMFMGVPFAMIFIAGGLGLLFNDTEYEQREWERKKEREVREFKWRNM